MAPSLSTALHSVISLLDATFSALEDKAQHNTSCNTIILLPNSLLYYKYCDRPQMRAVLYSIVGGAQASGEIRCYLVGVRRGMQLKTVCLVQTKSSDIVPPPSKSLALSPSFHCYRHKFNFGRDVRRCLISQSQYYEYVTQRCPTWGPAQCRRRFKVGLHSLCCDASKGLIFFIGAIPLSQLILNVAGCSVSTHQYTG